MKSCPYCGNAIDSPQPAKRTCGQQQCKRAHRSALFKGRYHDDPEFRAKWQATMRSQYHAKKEARQNVPRDGTG